MSSSSERRRRRFLWTPANVRLQSAEQAESQADQERIERQRALEREVEESDGEQPAE